MYALSPNADTGTLRETFCACMLSQGHNIAMPQKGDIVVDKKYLFEIGGRSKKYNQIAGIEHGFVVCDDVELGFENKIPLWLFGLLY